MPEKKMDEQLPDSMTHFCAQKHSKNNLSLQLTVMVLAFTFIYYYKEKHTKKTSDHVISLKKIELY